MSGTITRRHFGTLIGTGMVALAAGRAGAAGEGPYSLLVFSDPLSGQEEAYAKWQRGVTAAHRFVPGPIELRHTARKTPADLAIYTTRSEAALRNIALPPASCAALQTFAYRRLRPTTRGVGGEPQGATPGTPRRYIVLAFGDAVAGQEAAYDDWYDHVHQPELMAKAGVVGGTRGLLADVQVGPAADRPRYLFTLDLLTSDLAATFKGILDHAGAPSPALDRTRGFGFTYQPV